jgi:hypothetical protein
MAEITTTQAFSDGDTVTAAKLNNIVANASVGAEIITNRSELTTIDGAADFVLGYDTSATDLRKIKPDNLIGTGSVSTAKIADSAVTTAKINDSSVTTSKIADDAITSGKIAAGAVGTSDIADAAVTSAKADSSSVAILGTAQEYTRTHNFNCTTLADGATINWDLSQNQVAKVTLGGNRTFAAPTNLVEGATYILVLIQDGTGSRTIAWNAAYKFAGGTAPTLTTTANRADVITFVCIGSVLFGVSALNFVTS